MLRSLVVSVRSLGSALIILLWPFRAPGWAVARGLKASKSFPTRRVQLPRHTDSDPLPKVNARARGSHRCARLQMLQCTEIRMGSEIAVER